MNIEPFSLDAETTATFADSVERSAETEQKRRKVNKKPLGELETRNGESEPNLKGNLNHLVLVDFLLNFAIKLLK